MYTGFYLIVVTQRLVSLCGHSNRIFATAHGNRMIKKPVAILYLHVSSFYSTTLYEQHNYNSITDVYILQTNYE